MFLSVKTVKQVETTRKTYHRDQLVYGNGGLNTSIAVSLFNHNIYNPPNKKSFK